AFQHLRVLGYVLACEPLAFFLVILGKLPVEDEAEQVVLYLADPATGLSPEDTHQVVAVQGTAQLFYIFLRFDFLATPVERVYSGERSGHPLGTRRRYVGTREGEEALGDGRGLAEEAAHGPVGPAFVVYTDAQVL